MLAQEEYVEAHALRKRGWSISAIARHLGRDRKTAGVIDQHPQDPNTSQAQPNRHNIRHRGLPEPANVELHRFQRGLTPTKGFTPTDLRFRAGPI